MLRILDLSSVLGMDLVDGHREMETQKNQLSVNNAERHEEYEVWLSIV